MRSDQPLLKSLGVSSPETTWVRALSAGHPLLLVIYPDSSYRLMENGARDRWTADGDHASMNRHAVTVIGYFRNSASFVIQDSRGPKFGRGGQWLLSERAAASTRHLDTVHEIGRSELE
jgi:hypothetical protein